MSALSRLRRAMWGISQEMSWGVRHLRRGRVAYLLNVLAYRLLAVTSAVPGKNRLSFLETDSGVRLYYRRNRGDIQGIREILVDEIYRLPAGARPSSLVDLGANIGIATVWLCHEYSLRDFAAVEPIGENFGLLERNCQANGLIGTLICAAVGPQSGTTTFDTAAGSNMGRVGEGKFSVTVRGIEELLRGLTFDVSLLKMDVEGMEKDLLVEVDPAWISAFSLIVMEMHPQYVSIDALVRTICDQDFTYFAPIETTQGIRRSKRERLFVHNPCLITR